MRVSLNWLRTFVDLPDTEQLIDQLNGLGLEVESTILYEISKVVVGQIVSIEKHPDADRLVVCQLDVGEEQLLQIVTGATNISVQDKVPVALHGAVLAQGFKIKKSKLRGVISNGMLCSQKELGLGDEASGIWILQEDLAIGEDFTKLCALNDVVLDIAILPNRGDCASILGIAREVAAINSSVVKLPSTHCEYQIKTNPIRLTVTDSQACPLYTGHYLTGLKDNHLSPLWMQVQLLKAGVRSINLAVDITNYVCLEWGQPMHAFDAADIKGAHIKVQRLESPLKTLSLDEVDRELQKDDLVIMDEERIVALAGVMGSVAGSVQDHTDTVFLESAFFEPDVVRKQASFYRCHSESSFRFERFVDPEAVRLASQRAVFLFQNIAGLQASQPVEFFNHLHDDFQNKTIHYQLKTLMDYTSLPLENGLNPLEKLGFKVADTSVDVPSWRRRDCRNWPDLAEEILRLQGLDTIQGILPAKSCPVFLDAFQENLLEESIEFFLAKGFYQCQTFSFIDPAYAKTLGLEAAVHLANPMGPALAAMRPALWPNLLTVLKENLKHQSRGLAFCEAGTVFLNENKEMVVLEGLCYGPVLSESFLQKESPNYSDVAFLKGLIDSFFARYNLDISLNTVDLPSFLHPHAAATIQVSGKQIGFVGQLNPSIQKEQGIKGPVGIIKLELENLPEAKKNTFKAFSTFPSIRCDLAFVSNKSLSYQQVAQEIASLKDPLCVDFSVFDAYEGANLGKDKKSIGITFTYQADDRTLSDEDVQPLHTQLCETLKERLPIQFR